MTKKDTPVIIKVEGLEIVAKHGVSREEQQLPQRLAFDIQLFLDSCKASISDDVIDTIDYEVVCRTVEEVVSGGPYHLLERLAHEVAMTLLHRFPATRVRIKASKLSPPMPFRVSRVAVELEMS